ncbi:ZmpA/ZmpB/ZmpC family metallo-endopeptidase-related protein [[Eubacterium] hominis]|uniref:ZmpA/ZmpB/ZmpC family metallo-endopeptidase-related protein n=1 Tax=[Eubacterium] hominis TaxID=2764325 RepID=UPI003A4D32EC
MLNAETNFRASLQLEEDSTTKSKKLSVKTQEASYVKAVLLLGDKEISRSTISVDKPAVFYIQANGTYTVQILDASDKVVETHDQEVSDFTDIRVERIENSDTLKLIGRISGCDHFLVTYGDVKQEVSITTTDGSSYSGEFTPTVNGVYTIGCIDKDGKQLGNTITYEVTDQKDAPVEEKPQQEEPQQVIHINNETDLKKINDQPSGNYILDRDIIITDTSSQTLVTNTFSGTLNGNGHLIKGLTQPVFASIKDAKLENISLQGSWEKKEGALLALQSENSTYRGIGIHAEISSDQTVAGMILKGNQDKIEKSYVSGVIQGEQAAGFIYEGKSTISGSYISGLISAKKEAYGFSKEADIENSYLIANVSAKTIVLFNQTEAKLENSFYDINLQEQEEPRADALTTSQILTLDLTKNDFFQSEKDQYPSMKDINWSEEAKKAEVLSRVALSLNENIHGITENVTLPTKINDVDMEWSSEGNIDVSNNTLKANVTDDINEDTTGVLLMKSSYGVLAYRSGSATQLSGDSKYSIGQSLAESKTQISFNADKMKYYFIAKASETVENPENHKVAIENGWKRYLWDGIINWSDLDWNTDYVLYEYSMDNSQLSKYEIKTAQGLIGGSVTISDNTAVGTEITATLSDDAFIKQGTWKWEKAKSLSSQSWEAIAEYSSVDTNETTSGYTPTPDDAGYYLRATFTVTEDLDYKGSVSGSTSNVVTQGLTSVSITENNAVVGTLLVAHVEPNGFDSDINYYWYHDGDTTVQGTGDRYLLSGKDVDEKIYVKAVAKSDVGVSGEVTSTSTPVIKKAKTEAPTVNPEVVTTETTDISVTVKMPDSIHTGLYQFGYIERNAGKEKTAFETYTRASNALTITGLKPNTTYYIYVRQIGENGYEDSEWSNSYAQVQTENEHIKGTVNIKNDPIYGKTLQAYLTGENPLQMTETTWYSINDDGTTNVIGSGDNFKIDNPALIGKRLRVVYKGIDLYAGEIMAETETVLKTEVHVPYNSISFDLSTVLNDTSVQLKLPGLDNPVDGLSVNEKYIIGYSLTKGGVPVEYREDGNVVKYEADQSVILNGFKHNTPYYFFLRYAETATHYKSDWSSIENCISLTTKKTKFTGNISFTYATEDMAIQGEKLIAVLDEANIEDGTWSWLKIDKDGNKENINNFFPVEGKTATYIMIPNDDAIIGARYQVTFTPNENYDGKAEETSSTVEKYTKEKYPTPTKAPVGVSKTDTTITFKMEKETEGAVYQFKYGESSDISKAKTADINAYEGTNVTITGLDRNKDYYIWVSQVGDQVKDASDYTSTYLKIKTEKTDLHGYVSIEKTPVVAEELTATYVKASYMPAGNDAGGTWQWYRKEGDNFIQISSAASNTYTPVTADIGKELKAVYTGTGDFQSEKSAVSAKTRKPVVANPVINDMKQIGDMDNQLAVGATLDTTENVWYILQQSNLQEPELPADGYTDVLMKKAGWTKTTTSSLQLNVDKDEKYLAPKTSYTLYVVKAETDTSQPSGIVSATAEVGVLTQQGTIALSGNVVVGQELKATLTNGNNTSGTWKWYVSTTDCGTGTTSAPSIGSENQWTQLSSGFYPSVDSNVSTLTISEDMFKKYIKVEFVANESKNYKGTVKSEASSFVKKVYDESLTLTSSTKDGNGDPKAYAGTIITGTIDNYIESETLDKTRAKVTFNIDTSIPTAITPEEFKVDVENSKATFSYKMPEIADYDGKTISATVSKPKDNKLYVDKEFKAITTTDLKSIDTNSNFGYTYGIPISNSDELEAFMKQTGLYSNRAYGTTYIITDNINMSDKGVIAYSTNSFGGTLDGDFHTITGLKNVLIGYLGFDNTSNSSNPAVVKNLIVNEANINTTSVSGQAGAGAVIALLSKYAKLEKIMVTNADIYGGNDGGLLTGGLGFDSNNKDGYGVVNECGAAGGSIKIKNSGPSVGGLIGHFRAGIGENNFSLSSTVNFGGGTGNTGVGGLIGSTGTITMKNSFSNSTIGNGGRRGGIIASGSKANGTNLFYDKTLLTESLTQSDATGWGKATSELIGTSLQSTYGTEFWTYATGYYPRLKWVSNHPISTLYASTRGAFAPLTSADTSDTLLTGTINGPINVPKELQKATYTYSSSAPNILKVTEGGTIIPVGNSGESADITITYNEPDLSIGGFASNKYTFTIGNKVTALSSLSIDKDKTHPGETLTATVSPASSISYQWYRRPQGTSDREKITGATNSTYTLQPADIGMEVNVDVTYNGYATSSNYTAPITSVAPTAIEKDNLTDTSVRMMAKGVSGASYEYAYATAEDGKKTIAGVSTEAFTLNGLTRDTDYWLYARVAGATDGSYEPSPWSSAQKIHTEKTDIQGEVTLNGVVNMGDTLIATIPDTNLQTGSWKIERIASNGTVSKDLTTNGYADGYTITYKLTREDVGSRICISYNATGKFQDPSGVAVSATTETLLLQRQDAPSDPVEVAKEDHVLKVKETTGDSDTKYQFGYRKSLKDPITEISETYAINEEASINGLERNTTYYVYARKAAKTDFEPGSWSAGIQLTTEKTAIGTSTISISNENPVVEDEVTFTVKSTNVNTKDQTGLWVLERVGNDLTNTLLGTTSADTHTLTYKIAPEDSGYQLKATYIANGDYEGSVEMTTSNQVINHGQTIGAITPTVNENDIKTYTIGVSVTQESPDIYEFGYKKEGTNEIKVSLATATWGKTVELRELERDTSYDIYVRKAAKTGYDASDWSSSIIKKTKPEILSGNITFSGSTAVGQTITATYEKGTYEYDGDDTTGTWQWYLDGTEVEGETSDTLKIKPMEGNPVVSVKYTAAKNSGFEGTIEREFGKVYKPDYEVPSAATVTPEAEDNTREGSRLKLVNSATDGVYIYLRSSDNDTLPELELASKITDGISYDCDGNIERWIKAEAEMYVPVPANRSYIVYSARLEDDEHMASGISSARGVLSAKEPLLRTEDQSDGKIMDKDASIPWKALQEKQLTYSLYGKAPTATWKYYVQDPKGVSDVWQNIDAELKALGRKDEIDKSDETTMLVSTFEIPLKYKGYRLKAVLSGTQDYSGSVEFITDEIEGKLIKADGATIDASNTKSLLNTLTAKYTGDDDKSGIFHWYRMKEGETPTLIMKDTPNIESSYQLMQEDLGYYVYAEYHAAPGGLYSGIASTNQIYVNSKAEQKIPEPVEILQVNGNSIQVKAPSNYATDHMDAIPRVIMGYQETDEDGNPIDNTITWQVGDAIGNTWFKKLKKNTYYVFYAKFEGTNVYAPTPDDMYSTASMPVKTENELFDEKGLTLTYVNKLGEDHAETDIGNVLRMSFTGDGYQEGYFSVKRSNGDLVIEHVEATMDKTTETISYEYTLAAEDVGNMLIVEYIAKEDAERFNGTISKSSGKTVTKPKAKDKPETPVLVRGLDTNLFVEVNDAYEYYLSENPNAPDANSGDWDVLDKNNEEHPTQHEFRNLKRTGTYYLHARIAETEENLASESVTSDSQSPEEFINMGNVTVNNMKGDDVLAMNATASIDFPYTLNNEKLTITEMTMKRDVQEGAEETIVNANLRSVDVFKDGDGNATRKVIEAGSEWADVNFAVDIRLYKEDGSLASHTNGNGGSLDATDVKTMNIEVYRANAIAKGGTYIWQALIEDETGNEALLQSKVTFQTDVKAVVPIEVEMYLNANMYLKQISNTQRIVNQGQMPVSVGLDSKAEIGTDGIPALDGIYTGKDPEKGHAYLKISNDCSNYTSRSNGVWMRTSGDSKGITILGGLGHKAAMSYYATGIANPDQSWPFNGTKIEEAYKFRFVTQISEKDIGITTLQKNVFKEEE